ncbi:MAG: hypothetical protein IKX00_02960 [Bacilli bacterium]|nr:hypothetical protein [Bacilli bacterium]
MSNKVYLNGIIVVAVIFIGLAIFGTTNHFAGYYNPNKKSTDNNNNNDPKPNPNPNPDPDPKPTDKEIQGYKCTTNDCYILSGTSTINDKYLFIVDGTDNVVLFDITEKKVKETYKNIVVGSNNNFVAKNKEDKYSIIKVNDDVKELVPFEYTLIEYVKTKDNYILTKQNSSFVTDNNVVTITLTYNAQIVDYNDSYIITRTANGEYHIFNFNNNTELTEYVSGKRIFIELVKNFVGVVTEDHVYRLFDFKNGNKLVAEYRLNTSSTKFHAVVNSSYQLEIYEDDELVKTIDL